jgi:hypothetical protein
VNAAIEETAARAYRRLAPTRSMKLTGKLARGRKRFAPGLTMRFQQDAIVDQARKHRKRSPDEVARIQGQRALNRRG